MPKGEKGTSRPFLRGGVWYISYYVPGDPKQRRESSGSTDKSEALKLLNKRRSEADERQIAPGEATVDQLLDLFLQDQRQQKRRAYKVAESYVRNHLRPAFGKLKASRLTSEMVDRFIDQKQKKFANASINRYLAALHRAYKLGMERLPPLVHVIPPMKKLEENNERQGFLEHEQYERLREQLPDHQKLLLVIGYHLGMRRGEILQLRWDQVDWNANLIRLEKRQTKGKQGRVAPLYGELRAWLDMAFTARSEDCPFLIAWRGEGVGDVKNAWAKARERAGLPGLYIHDLRRTAIRNMIRAGIPEKRAMMISGHKTRSVFDRYDIVDERDIQADGERLERYLAEKKAQVNPKINPNATEGTGPRGKKTGKYVIVQ